MSFLVSSHSLDGWDSQQYLADVAPTIGESVSEFLASGALCYFWDILLLFLLSYIQLISFRCFFPFWCDDITTVVATQLRQIIGSNTAILISCVSLCSWYFTVSLVRVFRSPLITRLLLGLARLTLMVMSFDSYAVWSPCLTVRIILALGSTDSILGSTDNSLGSIVNRRRSSIQGASKRLVTLLFQATAKTSKGSLTV